MATHNKMLKTHISQVTQQQEATLPQLEYFLAIHKLILRDTLMPSHYKVGRS